MHKLKTDFGEINIREILQINLQNFKYYILYTTS